MNIIYETEVVVFGSGFKALSCAKSIAAAGKKVLLISSETYLGYEASAHNRFFFTENEYESLISLGCCNARQQYGSYYCYIPDELKLSLESVLQESGVKILYASCFLNEFAYEDKRAVVLANKAGKQVVICEESVRIPNMDYDRECGSLYRYGDIVNVRFDESIKSCIESRFTNIKVYPGAFDGGHIVLESRFDIPENLVESYEHKLNRKMLLQHGTARKLLLDCENIMKEQGFEKAMFGKMGFKPLPEIFDISGLINEGYDLARCILNKEISGLSTRIKTQIISSYELPQINNKLITVYENKIYDYKYVKKISRKSSPSPKQIAEKSYDIIVTGGGTSGVPAAIGASAKKTAIIEMNPILGGTATIGGVNAYWFGNRRHATELIDSATANWSHRLRTDYRGGWWSKHDVWNGDIKAFAMLDLCISHGIDVYFDQIIYGAVMDGDKIAGCVSAEESGQNKFLAEITIDATGDGDIAAFAGAEYIYGSKKDGITFWASLAQFTSPVSYKNNFSSTVYVGDPFDYTRFIMLNRSNSPCYDHGAYVAPRESRHIRGRCHISLEDILLGKTYESYIHTCFSNYDPKGKSSSDIIYFGLLPPNLEIQIPLDACLPIGIRCLAIAGKAFSCDHDAFPPLRMQPDLQEIGYSLGKIASYCVSHKLGFEELSSEEINRILNLKESREPCVNDPDKDISLLDGTESFEWIDMDPKMAQKIVPGHVKACLKREYLPYLVKAFSLATGRKKHLLAKILLWHGCNDGAELIINDILNELSQANGLAQRKGSISFCQLPPDHGVMPEIVYEINLLANSKNPRVVDILDIIFELLKNDKRDYHDIRSGIFSYIECFSFAAQKINDQHLDKLVSQIMDFPEFKSMTTEGILHERLLILYMTLAKSIANRDNKAAEVLHTLKNSPVTQIKISALGF